MVHYNIILIARDVQGEQKIFFSKSVFRTISSYMIENIESKKIYNRGA